MRRGIIPQRSRVGIALGCVALLVELALAPPVVAQSAASSRDRVPSELWKTYPFDPSRGTARIRAGPEADRQEVSPPSHSNTFTPSLIIVALLTLLLVVLVVPPVARNVAARRLIGGTTRRPIGGTIWFYTSVILASAAISIGVVLLVSGF